MKLISVKISNILSIEDAYVEFDDTGLVLVQGWNHDVGRANGAGKTAIFNAVTFALYDKLPRKITSTEILRRGCKAGFVELCVEVAGDRYVVRRSRPKGVAFTKAGNPITVTQEGWEQLLRLNYNQFIISMYTAQGTSGRFLSINDTDKKAFLLQLLNLEEFSSCKKIADDKITIFKETLTKLNSKGESITSKIDAYSESLVDEDSVKQAISNCSTSIKSLQAQFFPMLNVVKPDLSKYQKLEEDIYAKKTQFTKTKARREMLHDQYKKLKAKIVPFSMERACESCGSELDLTSAEAQHKERMDLYKVELSTIKADIDNCENALLGESSINDLQTRLRTKKADESRDYESASTSAADIQSKINLRQQELQQLNLRLQNNSELQSKIKELNGIQAKIVNEGASISRDIELYKTVSAMYSPTGAQAYILDSVIESFNERIVEYVKLLWSNLTYELKSYKENVRGDVTAKFSESLVMDGNDISIGSLSGGEFKALSLCVDFALIDVMERQFGISMSPVILDEPFNDLDGSGRELIVELLETISVRRQVVVIDHASEVKSMFSKVINVDKRKGVSVVSMDT